MIVFPCSQCGTPLQAYEANRGKRARCPCGAIRRVPMRSEAIDEQEDWQAEDLWGSAGDEDRSERYDETTGRYESPEPWTPPQSASTRPSPQATQPVRPVPTPGINIGAIIWGLVLMAGAGAWLVASLAAGRFSSFPVVLFIIGVVKFFGGLKNEP